MNGHEVRGPYTVRHHLKWEYRALWLVTEPTGSAYSLPLRAFSLQLRGHIQRWYGLASHHRQLAVATRYAYSSSSPSLRSSIVRCITEHQNREYTVQ